MRLANRVARTYQAEGLGRIKHQGTKPQKTPNRSFYKSKRTNLVDHTRSTTVYGSGSRVARTPIRGNQACNGRTRDGLNTRIAHRADLKQTSTAARVSTHFSRSTHYITLFTSITQPLNVQSYCLMPALSSKKRSRDPWYLDNAPSASFHLVVRTRPARKSLLYLLIKAISKPAV